MNFSHETLSLNVFIVRDNKACLFGLKIVFSNPLSLEDNSINASTIVETKILATGYDLFLIANSNPLKKFPIYSSNPKPKYS